MTNHSSLSTTFTNSTFPVPCGWWMCSKYEEILYMTIYGIITVAAILGNLIVIITISYNRNMRNVMYTLLLALCVSDLIFSVMSPFHVRFVISPGKWDLAPLGDAGCKIYYFLFRALYAFSILTLIVITIDRYLVISFPLNHPRLPAKRWIFSSLIIASFAFSAPLLKAVGSMGERGCYNIYWKSHESFKIYYLTIYVVLFIVPIILMTAMYSKIWRILRRPVPGSSNNQATNAKRRRTALMLTFVVFSFIFSWTPWCMLEAWLVYLHPENPTPAFVEALNYSMLPVYASAAINPILYCLFSAEFRRCAIDIVFYRRCSKYRKGSRSKEGVRHTTVKLSRSV